MSNMWGRSGAPMIQPTKDQFREWLSEAHGQLKEERIRRRLVEYKLNVATRKLGALVLEGKIAIPTERLGEIALQMAIDEEVESETKKLPSQV
jgi:hypothetical protein